MFWQRSRAMASVQCFGVRNESKTFHKENVREVSDHPSTWTRLGDLFQSSSQTKAGLRVWLEFPGRIFPAISGLRSH